MAEAEAEAEGLTLEWLVVKQVHKPGVAQGLPVELDQHIADRQRAFVRNGAARHDVDDPVVLVHVEPQPNSVGASHTSS